LVDARREHTFYGDFLKKSLVSVEGLSMFQELFVVGQGARKAKRRTKFSAGGTSWKSDLWPDSSAGDTRDDGDRWRGCFSLTWRCWIGSRVKQNSKRQGALPGPTKVHGAEEIWGCTCVTGTPFFTQTGPPARRTFPLEERQ
jgi:hypothetical protein